MSGPRGRRLCLRFATSVNSQTWTAMRYAAEHPSDDDLLSALVRVPRDIDPTSIATTDEKALLASLAESVDAATYWQEPDQEDRLLTNPTIVDALRPIAEALASAPNAAWWSSAVALTEQRHVTWLDEGYDVPLSLVEAAGKLEKWKAATLLDEQRSRPTELSASISGQWWSTPAMSLLPTTTRSLPGLGAVGLTLVEDRFGWAIARVTALLPKPGCLIYEITGPEAWSELVRRYPLDVTRSKRQDWWRATGHDGSWAIPDWQAVSADFDGVHLTVSGYLSTAGRALPAGAWHTVLAGWNPDQTYWLTDVLSIDGAATEWQRDEPHWSIRWPTEDTR